MWVDPNLCSQSPEKQLCWSCHLWHFLTRWKLTLSHSLTLCDPHWSSLSLHVCFKLGEWSVKDLSTYILSHFFFFAKLFTEVSLHTIHPWTGRGTVSGVSQKQQVRHRHQGWTKQLSFSPKWPLWFFGSFEQLRFIHFFFLLWKEKEVLILKPLFCSLSS